MSKRFEHMASWQDDEMLRGAWLSSLIALGHLQNTTLFTCVRNSSWKCAHEGLLSLLLSSLGTCFWSWDQAWWSKRCMPVSLGNLLWPAYWIAWTETGLYLPHPTPPHSINCVRECNWRPPRINWVCKFKWTCPTHPRDSAGRYPRLAQDRRVQTTLSRVGVTNTAGSNNNNRIITIM